MQYKPTILYVEDEEGIRENVKRPLGYFSSELYIACDGQEGLALYKEHLPDIVVTDIKMPNMSGIEMSQAIKAINPKQYIIITTAHNEADFFMNAIEMHIDAYILKPIDLDLLEEQVIRISEQLNVKKELEKQIVLTEEISQLQNNYVIVLDSDKEIIFSNQKFLDFFAVSKLEEFIKKYNSVHQHFIQKDDYFYPNKDIDIDWIQQIERLKSNKRLITMLDTKGEEYVFLISLAHIEKSNHTVISFVEVTTLALEKNALEKKAYHDALTKIHNRTYFEETFCHAIMHQREKESHLSFMMLDIDKFKLINDTYGHQVGDDILVELAQLVESKTRKTDSFARWGGEEFVMILPQTTLEMALRVAENLREIIASHTFSHNLSITCSFGVASLGEGESQKSVMKRADEALYRAKQAGRNRVES